MSARLDPLPLEALTGETRAAMEAAADVMGFMPNDGLIMARRPDILHAFAGLERAIYGRGTLDPGFKRLIGEATSLAAECAYCVAHTAHGAAKRGVAEDKIAAVAEADCSPLFSQAERAAIRVARRAGQVPNAVTDADIDALKAHFDEGEIVEIVAVIAMFGFLNRWNSTLGSDIEAGPLASARHIGLID